MTAHAVERLRERSPGVRGMETHRSGCWSRRALESDGFFAEDEVIAFGHGDVVDGFGSTGGEEPGVWGGCCSGGLVVVFEGVVVGEVEAGPIVEACSSAGFLVDVESEGGDEVEGGAGRYAGSSDGSGVVGDLGIEEDDMGDGVLRGGLSGGLCGFWGSHGLGVIDGWIKRNTPLRMSRRGVGGFVWEVD